MRRRQGCGKPSFGTPQGPSHARFACHRHDVVREVVGVPARRRRGALAIRVALALGGAAGGRNGGTLDEGPGWIANGSSGQQFHRDGERQRGSHLQRR